MRQRVMIAMALLCNPSLLIADEPTTALDVTIQAQILDLMMSLKDKREEAAILLITHDLAVVNFIADRVAVMYLGKIVEIADRDILLKRSRHPYSQALRAAVPKTGTGKRRRGTAPAGDPPDPSSPPTGCPFHTRCPKTADICRKIEPDLELVDSDIRHQVACHFK